MGKKHDKKGKKKVVLSLAEFNEDAGLGGVDPELAALPTAPKGADEWEAQGGRPEYNSRGYKERNSSAFKDRGYDDDFDERDWSRRGPLAEREQSSEFGAGAERDWGGMRRGPVEAEGGAPQERDWNDMRRAPVDSSFATDTPPTRDWGVRKGPIDAEAPTRVIGADDWGKARRTPVEAEPVQGKAPVERDWSARKPIEAEVVGKTQEADWSAPRRGPIEAERQPGAAKDWAVRKGPIETEAPKTVQEADWSGVRRGPIEVEVPKQREEEVDWGRRRQPIDVSVKKEEAAGSQIGTNQKAVRAIDFSEMRRGSKFKELTEERALQTPPKSDASRATEREHWRRDSQSSTGRRGSQEGLDQQNPKTPDDSSTPKERDWGAARRAQPMKANPRFSRPGSGHGRDTTPGDQNAGATESSPVPEADGDNNDDWTTVRSAGHRRSLNRRSGGRDSSHRRRSGPRQGEDHRMMRPAMGDGSKVTTTSPVTPVTSTVSES